MEVLQLTGKDDFITPPNANSEDEVDPALRLELPIEKDLIILKLPRDESRRKGVYDTISKYLERLPWTQTQDGLVDSKDISTGLKQQEAFSSGNETPSLVVNQSKGKQRDLTSERFYSSTECTESLGTLGTPPCNAIEARSLPREIKLVPKRRESTSCDNNFVPGTLQDDNGETDFYRSIFTHTIKQKTSSATIKQRLTDADDLLGGTAKITRGAKVLTTRGDNLGLVFKRTKAEIDDENQDVATVYRAVLSEVYILGHPVVRHHPNINNLQGICWEVVQNRPWPVLIFKQAPYGDLGQFMRTEEGRNLGLKDKIKLCWEMGNALHLMHSCNAVHGDIKPENVLICKDADGRFLAQVIDFGYSTIFADEENEEVTLPTSWPWTAPEIKPQQPVTLEQAKAADIFSYGLLCFWLLCYGVLEPEPGSPIYTPNRYTIDQNKSSPRFAADVCNTVASILANEPDDIRQRLALDYFFQRVLFFSEGSQNQEKRVLDVDTLPRLFGLPERPLPLLKKYGKSSLLKSQASFKLPALLSRLSRCPQIVIGDVFKRLVERTEACLEDDSWDASLGSLAYDLALCHELGLGTDRSPEMAEIWCNIAGTDRAALGNVVKMMESDTNGFYTIFNLEFSDRHSSLKRAEEKENDAIKFSVPWLDKILEQKDDESIEYDSRVIDLDDGGDESWVGYLEKGKDEEGFFVSWMQFNSSSHDNRDTSSDRSISSSQLVVFPASTKDILDREALRTKQIQLCASLEAKRNVIGSEHQDTLKDINTLYYLYCKSNEPTSTILALQEEIFELQQAMFGPENPETEKSTQSLAKLYMQRKEWEKARPLIMTHLATVRKAFDLEGEIGRKAVELLETLIEKEGDVPIHHESASTATKRILAQYMLLLEAYGRGDVRLLAPLMKVMNIQIDQLMRHNTSSREGDDIELLISTSVLGLKRLKRTICDVSQFFGSNHSEVARAKEVAALGHLTLGAVRHGKISLPEKLRHTVKANKLLGEVIFPKGSPAYIPIRHKGRGAFTLDSNTRDDLHRRPEVYCEGPDRLALWIAIQSQLNEFISDLKSEVNKVRKFLEKVPGSFLARAGSTLELAETATSDPGRRADVKTGLPYLRKLLINLREAWALRHFEGPLLLKYYTESLLYLYSSNTHDEDVKDHFDEAVEFMEQEVHKAENEKDIAEIVAKLYRLLEQRYEAHSKIGDLQNMALWSEQMSYLDHDRNNTNDSKRTTNPGHEALKDNYIDWLQNSVMLYEKIYQEVGGTDSREILIAVCERLLRERGILQPLKDVVDVCVLLASLYLDRGVENSSSMGVLDDGLLLITDIGQKVISQIFYNCELAGLKPSDSDPRGPIDFRALATIGGAQPHKIRQEYEKAISLLPNYDQAANSKVPEAALLKSVGPGDVAMVLLRVQPFMAGLLAICFLLRFFISNDERGAGGNRRQYLDQAQIYTELGSRLIQPTSPYIMLLDEINNSIASIKNKLDQGEVWEDQLELSSRFKHLRDVYFPYIKDSHVSKQASKRSIPSGLGSWLFRDDISSSIWL
ncbi:hypothetical protein TWF173_004904 [Orbilia oligospora]|nr:hypothetical protein TWF173_004904 [Orbilia oligospora]